MYIYIYIYICPSGGAQKGCGAWPPPLKRRAAIRSYLRLRNPKVMFFVGSGMGLPFCNTRESYLHLSHKLRHLHMHLDSAELQETLKTSFLMCQLRAACCAVLAACCVLHTAYLLR